VQQYFVTAERRDKVRLLKILLKHDQPEATIIFTNTKHIARKLTQQLHKDGIQAMEIHGDLMQKKRDKAAVSRKVVVELVRGGPVGRGAAEQ
jgi:ATP-independent RNA helicase DbpA